LFPALITICTYPWQVYVRDDDLVQSAWCVLPSLAGVSTRMILVGGVFTSVPWLGAVNLGDWVLGGRRGWVTGEMPSSKTEGARHDCEENLMVELASAFI